MIAFISTSYFTIKEQPRLKKLRTYWWKNCVLQIIKYNNKNFILVTIGHGKTNAAMIATYLIEKYPGVKSVINLDIALSTKEKYITGDIGISTKFVYRDVDQTVFTETKYGQVFHETETFQFDYGIANTINNLKFGLLDSVIGTGDALIYNSKQYKEMIMKYGESIDIIDEEAGALAQVFKKTKLNFVSVKVVYGNALSPWEKDPKHFWKMYEVTNTFRYLVKRLLNFLSSDIDYSLLKCNKDTVDTITHLVENVHDDWAKNIKSDTSKVLSVNNTNILLLDNKEKNNYLVNIVKVQTKTTNQSEYEKSEDENFLRMQLGLDDWKNSSIKWRDKMDIISQIHMNESELLLNNSSSNLQKDSNSISIQKCIQNIKTIIANKGQDVEKVKYSNKSIDKRVLLLNIEANLTFYISQNSNHDLIEDNKLGSMIIYNEFLKIINKEFKDQNINLKYEQIVLYIHFPALFGKNNSLVFYSSISKISNEITFGKCNSSILNDYTVVDNEIVKEDTDNIGSFRTSILLKSKA